MAVPRSRVSNRRKNSRRAHDAKNPQNVSNCPSCGNARQPHTICQSCGSYGKRVIFEKESQE